MSNFISDAVGSVAGWWTNTFGAGAGLAAQSAALDAQIAANQKDYQPGGKYYTPTNAAASSAQYAAMLANTVDISSSITSAAQTGAATGLDSVTSAIANPFSKIPVAWYVLAGLGLFLWLGGLSWIRGALAKKSA